MIIDSQLLNKVSEQARQNERLRMNFNFHLKGEAPSQRLLNALEPGTQVPVHRHQHTGESYILLRGKMRVYFHNAQGDVTETFELDPLNGQFGVEIPLGQWHSLEVLETGTVIFEAKDGPYAPISPEDVLN